VCLAAPHAIANVVGRAAPRRGQRQHCSQAKKKDPINVDLTVSSSERQLLVFNGVQRAVFCRDGDWIWALLNDRELYGQNEEGKGVYLHSSSRVLLWR